MTELIEKTIQWGIDKGLTGPNGKATYEGQYIKLLEEMHELFVAIRDNNEAEIKDALGDLQVVAIQGMKIKEDFSRDIASPEAIDTLLKTFPEHNPVIISAIIFLDYSEGDPKDSLDSIRALATKLGYDPDQCLQLAYDVISKRTGKMVDGVFVKDVNTKLENEDAEEALSNIKTIHVCLIDLNERSSKFPGARILSEQQRDELVNWALPPESEVLSIKGKSGPGDVLCEVKYITKLMQDDDLDEPLPAQQCNLEGEVCESCQ